MPWGTLDRSAGARPPPRPALGRDRAARPTSFGFALMEIQARHRLDRTALRARPLAGKRLRQLRCSSAAPRYPRALGHISALSGDLSRRRLEQAVLRAPRLHRGAARRVEPDLARSAAFGGLKPRPPGSGGAPSCGGRFSFCRPSARSGSTCGDSVAFSPDTGRGWNSLGQSTLRSPCRASPSDRIAGLPRILRHASRIRRRAEQGCGFTEADQGHGHQHVQA